MYLEIASLANYIETITIENILMKGFTQSQFTF